MTWHVLEIKKQTINIITTGINDLTILIATSNILCFGSLNGFASVSEILKNEVESDEDSIQKIRKINQSFKI